MNLALRALATVAVALLSSFVLAASAAAAPSWTAPSWTVGASVQNAWDARVDVDAAGNAIAVWQTGIAPVTLWSRSRPAGGAWGDPIRVVSDGNVYYPEVGLDGSGNATVIWAGGDGSAWNVHSARLAAGASAWSAPHVFPSDAVNMWGYALAVAPDGSRVASWIEDDGGQTSTMRAVTGSGDGWNAPETVSSGEDEDYIPPTATIVDGGDATLVYVAYVGAAPTGGEVWAARNSGDGWTVSTVAPSARIAGLRAAGAPDGRVAASWFELGDGTSAKLRAAIRENGSWSLHDVSPDVTWDGCGRVQDIALGGGGATVAWQSDSTARGLSASDGDASGWGPARTVWQPLVGQEAGDLRLVAGAAGPTAVWIVSEADGYEVRAAQRGPGGWLAIPGGPRVGAENALVFQTTAAGDAAGNVLVGWSPFEFLEPEATMRATGIQTTPPRLDALDVPSSGDARSALAFSVRASSVFAGVERATWNFGDGSPTVTGDVVTHPYAHEGDYTVTVSVADSVGNVTTATRRVRIGKGGPAPVRPVLNPPFVRHRGGVLRLAPGARTLRVRLVNRDAAALTGSARLGRFARVGGRPAIRTLSLRRGVKLRSRGQATVTFRLPARALRQLRAAPKRSYPVRIELRMRAADGRRVRSSATFTFDGREAFRKYAKPRGSQPRPDRARPVGVKAVC